jgi:hypothetical protein
MYGLRHDRDGVDHYVDAGQISQERTSIEVGRYDRVTQRVDKCHIGFSAAGITLDPLALRYIWPAELDLMAQLAGFELESRHADRVGTEFTAESRSHVSVYRLPTLS